MTDISLRALVVARNTNSELLPVQADALKQPFRSAKFDFIILSEVIEHIHPDVSRELLAEIARLLHQNGVALITTPNGMEYRRMLLWWPIVILSKLTCIHEMRIASKLYQVYCKLTGYKTAKAELFKKYGFLEHINILTPQKLVRQARSAGLIVESVRFSGVRPILSFPFKYSRKRIKVLQHIDETWKVGRFFLCSGMYLLLRRAGPGQHKKMDLQF